MWGLKFHAPGLGARPLALVARPATSAGLPRHPSTFSSPSTSVSGPLATSLASAAAGAAFGVSAAHGQRRGCVATAAAAGAAAAVASAVSAPPVRENLARVLAKVDAAVASRGVSAAEGRKIGQQDVRLVAVSKTKPVEALVAAYEAGHRYFGENYVQELVQKAPELPEDIQWHFIGRLQSNKVSTLIKGCPKLACVETVASEKLAKALNKAVQAVTREAKLKVMLQVNSSGEESKGGIEADQCVPLATFVAKECPHLELAGLMTIGAPDYSGCRTEDFETLHRCRREVAEAVSVEEESLELSMGMSNDFENAILQGSTSVRVGSSIFGARDYSAQ